MAALGGNPAEGLEIRVRRNRENKVELLKKINLYDYFKKEPLSEEFVEDSEKKHFPKTGDIPQETFWLDITSGVKDLKSSNLYAQIQKVRHQLSWIMHGIKFGGPEQQMRVMERIWDLYLELSWPGHPLREAFFKLRNGIAKQPLGLLNPSKNYRIKKLKEEISRWIRGMFYDKARSEEDIMIAVARASFVIPNFLRYVYEARKKWQEFVKDDNFGGFFTPVKHPYIQSVARFNGIFELLQLDIILLDMMAINHPAEELPLNLSYENVAEQDRDNFINIINGCQQNGDLMKAEIMIQPTMDEFVMNDCGGHVGMAAPGFPVPEGTGDAGFFLDRLITQTRNLLQGHGFAECEVGLFVDEYAVGETVPDLNTAVECALGKLGCCTGNIQ